MGTADADAGGARQAMFWVVLSGVIWAFEILAWRFAAARGMGSFTMVAWTSCSMGVGGALMLAYTQVTPRTDEPAHAGSQMAKMGCTAAGISWIVACLCFNTGMAGMSNAGVANGISVVVQTTTIIVASWFVFGEKLDDARGIGGVMMMMGMVLVNLR